MLKNLFKSLKQKRNEGILLKKINSDYAFLRFRLKLVKSSFGLGLESSTRYSNELLALQNRLNLITHSKYKFQVKELLNEIQEMYNDIYAIKVTKNKGL